jgi:hypothetical protein
MPVSIEITGENAHEALADLRALTAGFSGPSSVEPAGTTTDEDAARISSEQQLDRTEPTREQPDTVTNTPRAGEEPGKRPRGRPKKDAAPAPATEQPMMSAAQAEELQAPAVAENPQDAADEAEESEANKPAILTHDDLRQAMGAYVKKFGLDAAQKNVGAIMGFGKVSEVPEDKIAEAIGKWNAATASAEGLPA